MMFYTYEKGIKVWNAGYRFSRNPLYVTTALVKKGTCPIKQQNPTPWPLKADRMINKLGVNPGTSGIPIGGLVPETLKIIAYNFQR